MVRPHVLAPLFQHGYCKSVLCRAMNKQEPGETKIRGTEMKLSEELNRSSLSRGAVGQQNQLGIPHSFSFWQRCGCSGTWLAVYGGAARVGTGGRAYSRSLRGVCVQQEAHAVNVASD